MSCDYPVTYPNYLVPKSDSPYPFNPDDAHLLCRWGIDVDSNDKVKGEIPDSCFQKEQLFDFSTNLLPLSKERDVKIKILASDKCLGKWYQGIEGYAPKSDNPAEFEWVGHREYFFLLVSKIKNFIPDTQNEPIIINGKTFNNCSFTLRYKHDPTLSNYAHFVIYPVITIEGVEFSNLDSLLEFFEIDKSEEKKMKKFYEKMAQLLRRSYKIISRKKDEVADIPPCIFEHFS